jgi:hypothetical protein
MIDSDCAHPTDERRTRNRPGTTDTPAPTSFHLVMAWRTTSGRRDDIRPSARTSAVSAFALDRAELHVEGRQLWWAAIHRSSSSPTVRNGTTDRAVLSELLGEFTPAPLGVLKRSVEPERTLDRAARDGIDADRDADLEDPWSTFAQRSLAPDSHEVKKIGSLGDPYFLALSRITA